MGQLGHIEDGGEEALEVMVPEHLRAGVSGYALHGTPVGDFLQAVIANDLFDAATRADYLCLPRLADIARWFIYYAPDTCKGTRSAYDDWIRRGQVIRERSAPGSPDAPAPPESTP